MNTAAIVFVTVFFAIINIVVNLTADKTMSFIQEKYKERIKTKYNEYYTCYQPNPARRNTGDCSIRAVSKMFGVTWNHALDIIVDCSKRYCEQTNNMINLNTLMYDKLNMHVYEPKRTVTFGEFAKQHPTGAYMLNSDGHVCACVGGMIYDSWNSTAEKIIMYSAVQDDNITDDDITFTGVKHHKLRDNSYKD